MEQDPVCFIEIIDSSVFGLQYEISVKDSFGSLTKLFVGVLPSLFPAFEDILCIELYCYPVWRIVVMERFLSETNASFPTIWDAGTQTLSIVMVSYLLWERPSSLRFRMVIRSIV